MDSRTLVLLRHAKASAPGGVADPDRPLTERGRRDAVAAGEQLVEWDLELDLVLCSTAVRTRQTWDQVVAGGAESREVRYLSQIYNASAEELTGLVRALPETAEAVLLLGHGPGLPQLAAQLAGGSAPPWDGYPTTGLAWFSLDGPWGAASADHAELEAFAVPRG